MCPGSYRKSLSTDKYYFREAPFNKLMKNRITEVLLVCSKYDKFMLEEDGRIDEQIFEEYASLNLRYPPRFTQVSTAEEAFEKLEKKYYDLVITMLNIGDTLAFDLAKQIKGKYSHKPVVVLTHFSREVSMKLENEDLSCIDYVFSWLGNAGILLAIVKLIEDKMNIENDVKTVGVQAIILVEDSIRYYSSYLPIIYRIIFQQTRKIMVEGLNEHQQTLRMRGRPKILLANNFEQAMEFYEKYKDNVLGVITDITYKREDEIDKLAGLKLCLNIRNENEYLPVLIQSSQLEHKMNAEKFNAGFIHKHSKTLLKELKDFIKRNFGFGDFVFRNPDTMEEVYRISNLRSLQHDIEKVPNDSFVYHAKQNHLSKWLKARALYTLASIIQPVSVDDFIDVDSTKLYIKDTIKNYRVYKSRGTIANFQKKCFDEYTGFSRIGNGSLGGKARGLAFIDSFLKRRRMTYKYEDVLIQIPKTIVLTTDIFEDFMENNDLYKIALSDIEDEKILDHFLKGKLPEELMEDLYAILKVIKNPIAVRSSSLLEDSHYQPFAGVYSTYMISNNNDDTEIRFKDLTNAIKAVFASTYYKSSKDYMLATHNVIDEEKMAVILQEVSGNSYGDIFYPTISGVARSLNFYPIESEKSEEGIANIALGLGKTIVEGGVSLRFSPKHPKKIIQLSDTGTTLRTTQNRFYALDMKNPFVPNINEACTLIKPDVKEAEGNKALKYVASTFDFKNGVIRDGMITEGRKVINFAGVLKYGMFPLAQILQELLEVGSCEMNVPVEIEFAINLDKPAGVPKSFKFLQIRPIVEGLESEDIDIREFEKENMIIYSKKALGNGTYDDIHDIVFVKPDSFSPANSREIAEQIEAINHDLQKEDKSYILVGPGRWGSTDPWLGIPVKWSQISKARVIVESSLKDFSVDPSQGSHFFQNVTSFRIAYLTINPHIGDGKYDLDFLNDMEPHYENKFLKHIRFKDQITVKVDGKKSKAAILKPGTN
jgi:hypothetical protein